jgi:hypothetical protein
MDHKMKTQAAETAPAALVAMTVRLERIIR